MSIQEPEIALYGQRTLYNNMTVNAEQLRFVNEAARSATCPYCAHALAKWDNRDFFQFIVKHRAPTSSNR